MKHLEGRVARGTVYSLASGDVQRLDLETLSGLLGGLADLTGQPVTPNDLLEVIETPAPLETPDGDVQTNLQDAGYALHAAESTVSSPELQAWLEATRTAVKPLRGNRAKA